MRLSVPSGEVYDVVFTTGYWSERLTAFWSTNPDGLWNNNTEVSRHSSYSEYSGQASTLPSSTCTINCFFRFHEIYREISKI